MRNATHAVDIIKAVRRRLEAGGAVLELDALKRMSVDELDRLVWLEINHPVSA